MLVKSEISEETGLLRLEN